MMKQFFNQNNLDNLELTHEFINKKNRYINLNNFRILKYDKLYATEKHETDFHWSKKYYYTRKMFK